MFINIRPEMWLLAGVVFIIYILKRLQRRKEKIPPGPTGLPIVGYIPFLATDAHLKFTKLAKKYGDVFSLNMGSKLVVVLNSDETIREAFSKKEFIGRPSSASVSIFDVKVPFFYDDIDVWYEHKRFTWQSMKDIGLKKSKLEELLEEEIRYFLEALNESNSQPIDPVKLLAPSMSNNIGSLAFGERYEYTDPVRIDLDNALDEATRVYKQTTLQIFFPWLGKLPFASRIWKYEKALKVGEMLKKTINDKIRMHKETLDPNNKRDFIDCYLLEMKSRVEKNPKTTFSDKMLEGTILALFTAGSETVRTLMSWCIYIIAAYPEIQKKARQEIIDVFGTTVFPHFTRTDLPYTYAVIKEILRWKTGAPISFFRYALDDGKIRGYDIPKGTLLIGNFHAVHYDESYWKDPEKFRPERFIDSDGSVLKTSHFMPFAVGKRICPGETMAMAEIFLYLVALLQTFEVKFPEGFQPTFEAELTTNYKLKPYKVCFKPIN